MFNTFKNKTLATLLIAAMTFSAYADDKKDDKKNKEEEQEEDNEDVTPAASEDNDSSDNEEEEEEESKEEGKETKGGEDQHGRGWRCGRRRDGLVGGSGTSQRR